jgi:amidohydrolase
VSAQILYMSRLLFLSALGAIIATALGLESPIYPETTSTQEHSTSPLAEEIDRRAAKIENQVIAWRRDIHQHPELSNREVRTAHLVADHLRRLGLEVETEVAHTGVVALLRGEKPGPVVALRADMDALPVTEEVDVPFASQVRAIYNGSEVGVMHACGHDAHTAMLMGVAEILTALQPQLPGSVKFIFQPAEEGPPAGEEGGAALMVEQGVLENPKPEVIFGLHISSQEEVGKIAYRSGPVLASMDTLRITVRGQQTHSAMPWRGVDPIVVAAQIVLGLQTIQSRQVDVTKEPAIVSIGSIHGGLRFNIIPDTVDMVGTIRTFAEEMRDDMHRRIRTTAKMIAKSAGAEAEVTIRRGPPVTINDAGLTEQMVPTLMSVVGRQNVVVGPKLTATDDVAVYLQRIPGFFFFLGIVPKGADLNTAAPNHSPRFYVDESGLLLGVRALAHLTVEYLEAKQSSSER